MKSSMENMHLMLVCIGLKLLMPLCLLRYVNIVSSGRFSPFCLRHAIHDKKKRTLLTGNHAQYLDLCCFLSDCHFLLKCSLIFLQVVSQV